MLSTLVSIALAAAMLQDTAVATSPSVPTAQPAAPAAAVTEWPLPAGAPSDDYGLVAWCHGALRGHLELAEQIRDTLPLDPQQQTLGREYLAGYEAALTAAPQHKTNEGPLRATRARNAGYVSWNAVRSAVNRAAQTDSYLGWQLPGRCDQAAKRLSSNADLLGAAIAAPPASAAVAPADAAPAPAEAAAATTPAETSAPATQP